MSTSLNERTHFGKNVLKMYLVFLLCAMSYLIILSPPRYFGFTFDEFLLFILKYSQWFLLLVLWFNSILTLPPHLCSAQQQYLRSEDDGKEEVTLRLLLHVSAQCNVCFPCTPSPTSSLHPQLTASSNHLVNTVRDDTFLEVIHSMTVNLVKWFLIYNS